MSLPNLRKKGAPGFTLVEMAIVLVIIGIILAGVMKGRDIVRGAQVKQFSQQFAQKWATIVQTYYDKTGQLLLDGLDNGSGAAGGATNGIASGALYYRMGTGAANSGITKLEGVGITPCTLIKSKLTSAVAVNSLSRAVAQGCTNVNEVQTQIEGEYTGNVVVTADFRSMILTMGTDSIQRNVVLLYNVPTDVAQGLDTAIDGKVDGASGSCIGVGGAYVIDAAPPTDTDISTTATTGTATAWDDAANAQVQTVGIILDF